MQKKKASKKLEEILIQRIKRNKLLVWKEGSWPLPLRAERLFCLAVTRLNIKTLATLRKYQHIYFCLCLWVKHNLLFWHHFRRWRLASLKMAGCCEGGRRPLKSLLFSNSSSSCVTSFFLSVYHLSSLPLPVISHHNRRKCFLWGVG